MSKSTLYEEIFAVVSAIPFGEIASYSQVARAIGMPRGARVVGWALGTLLQGSPVPWWRVVNMHRQLTIVNPKMGPEEQKALLEKEGFTLVLEGGLYAVTGDTWWVAPVVPPRSL